MTQQVQNEEIEEKPVNEYEETDEEFEAFIITEVNDHEENNEQSKND